MVGWYALQLSIRFFVISQLCVISVVNRLNIVKVSSLSPLWVVIELDPQLYHFQREMWPGGGGGEEDTPEFK